MIWVHLENQSDFERALIEWGEIKPREVLQVTGPIVRGPPHGDFTSYPTLDADIPAFNAFMKARGIEILAAPKPARQISVGEFAT